MTKTSAANGTPSHWLFSTWFFISITPTDISHLTHIPSSILPNRRPEYNRPEPLLTILTVKAIHFPSSGQNPSVSPSHGPEHRSVATSLTGRAVLYHAQGRYAEAESLHKRAQAIFERALGPQQPHVAQSLENYAALLRKTRRGTEAEKLEARAKAIRAKHSEQNPAN